MCCEAHEQTSDNGLTYYLKNSCRAKSGPSRGVYEETQVPITKCCAPEKSGTVKQECVRDGGKNASPAQKEAYWNCVQEQNKTKDLAMGKALNKERLEGVSTPPPPLPTPREHEPVKPSGPGGVSLRHVCLRSEHMVSISDCCDGSSTPAPQPLNKYMRIVLDMQYRLNQVHRETSWLTHLASEIGGHIADTLPWWRLRNKARTAFKKQTDGSNTTAGAWRVSNPVTTFKAEYDELQLVYNALLATQEMLKVGPPSPPPRYCVSVCGGGSAVCPERRLHPSSFILHPSPFMHTSIG